MPTIQKMVVGQEGGRKPGEARRAVRDNVTNIPVEIPTAGLERKPTSSQLITPPEPSLCKACDDITLDEIEDKIVFSNREGFRIIETLTDLPT